MNQKYTSYRTGSWERFNARVRSQISSNTDEYTKLAKGNTTFGKTALCIICHEFKVIPLENESKTSQLLLYWSNKLPFCWEDAHAAQQGMPKGEGDAMGITLSLPSSTGNGNQQNLLPKGQGCRMQ